MVVLAGRIGIRPGKSFVGTFPYFGPWGERRLGILPCRHMAGSTLAVNSPSCSGPSSVVLASCTFIAGRTGWGHAGIAYLPLVACLPCVAASSVDCSILG